MLAILSVVGVFQFVDDERARELRAWQIRLGIVADGRFEAVNSWLERQYGELTGLAENAALQIYATELSQSTGEVSRATDEAAQAAYLGNLLVVTADRAGFTGPVKGPDVRANVKRLGVAGIAIVDMAGRPLVATPAMPPLGGPFKTFLDGLGRAERGIFDLHKNGAGKAAMGFAVPLFAVQGNAKPSAQIGWVIGIKEVSKELYPLLAQPGEANETAEAILVRARGAVIEYLSPLGDGTPALGRALGGDTPELAAAFAIGAPGGFAIKRDYRDVEVLATSRSFAAVPWTLVSKIDRSEALAGADDRLARLLGILLLIIVLIAALIVAAWRHGTSRRAGEAARRYEDMARRYAAQSDFLRLVTDSQPNAIFITDEAGNYRFANLGAARPTGIESEDMVGKSMASVIGPAAARHYLELNRQALENDDTVTAVHNIDGDRDIRVLHSEHTPISGNGAGSPGVLVVESDITVAVTERARSERILSQLIETLVKVVDRRDPYAADHSARVAVVARAIAREMELDDVTAQTAEIAGRLTNLGKILVPTEVLTKSSRLSDEEIQQVRDSILASADLLEGIEFEGPVVETLRQLQERWDGLGKPGGLKGEEILITARIVAVANAFVAIVSPRAYRSGVGFDEAVEMLLSQVGTIFSRGVVAALINYLDNRQGRDEWSGFAEVPAVPSGP
jgi:PAS domain S-box-containing protein